MSKQSKSRKGLIAGIIAAVMLLVVLAVTMAACNNQSAEAAPTTQPTVAADSMEGITIYWNVDRAQYDGKSEAGMSSRKMESDGLFHVRLFKDGEITELKCADRKLINSIDVNDVVGIRVDEEGLISEAFSVAQLPIEKVAWKFYVQSVGGNTIKANSSDKFNGMEVVIKLENGMQVYDMSGAFDPIGTPTTAAINDRIMAYSDLDGNLLGVFIYDRSNMIIKTEGYCQHCDEVVIWQEWKNEKTLPTDGAQQTHYKLVTDIKLTGQQSMKADSKLCIDLNGHRVDGAEGKRMYSVHNLNCEVAIMDTSEGQTGVMAGHGDCNVQGVVLFVRYGAVYLYGGTIDASDVVVTHGNGGAAVYVAAQRFFYMNGGEIIGGTAVHQYNAETKKYSAGMGATIYNKGKFVLNDGVIRDGYAKSVKTVSNGKVTYQRGIGGNYFGSSGSVLEINGGVIKNGKAGTGGNIFLDGTAEMIMNNGTITGGRTTDPGRNAGNIYIGAKATVTINCGTISGGLTRNLGGNIYLLGRLTMNGGVINRGKCLDATTGLVKPNMTSHNLYVGGGARFSLYGGKIYGSVAVAGTAADANKKTYVHFDTHAWIDSGDYGKNLSVLSAAQKPVITVGKLRGKALIGVTAAGIFTAETSENNLAFFRSDIAGADVLYVDNCLAMGRMACLCGSEEHFGACDGTELLWGPWTSNSTLPTTEGNYYLLNDVTRTASTSIGSTTDNDFTVSLDLNGHSVTSSSRVALIYADVNIVDHKGGGIMTGTGYSTNKEHTTGLLVAGDSVVSLYAGTLAAPKNHYDHTTGGVLGIATTATLNIFGGTVDGSNAKGERTDADGNTITTTIGKGGAIRLSGTMNMTGGTVIGGETTTNGGAIYMEKDAVLNMVGGTIKGGKSVQGGNIYMDGSSVMNLVGGTVTGGSTMADAKNSVSNSNGGNIYVNKSATINIAAGSVEDGFSVNGGGNIYMAGALNMTGGKIVGGDSSSNAQRFSKNIMAVNGDITMSGGTIDGYVSLVSNNTQGSTITVSGKPVIAGGEYNLRLVSTDTSKYPRPVVTVNGVLQDGAKIVINETGVVSGVTVEENVKAFECTDPFNTAILNEEKCVALGYVHCLCSQDTHESWCDGKDLLWEPWDGKSGITKAGNYYLSANVTGGGQRSMGQSGKAATINLDLCGKTYEGSSRAMLVYCDLNIVDSIGGGKLTGNGTSNNHSGTLLMAKGAEVNLYQGTISVESDHNVITNGGVVGVGGGATLNVWPDGVIDGSAATVNDHGGAIRVTGVLNLKGGTVIGGKAKVGGTIGLEEGGVVNMTSGLVTGGNAATGSGGNFGLFGGSTVNITGGTVSDGEALNTGGNIYVAAPEDDQEPAVFTLGGNAIVQGGKNVTGSKHGGSVYIAPGSQFIMEGNSTVKDGVSLNGGGNFYVGGTLTIRDNALVTGGTAKGSSQHYGRNILVNTGTLNLEGGVVEGYISAVNLGNPASCFINISGSPEVNKGATNLRLTYTGTGVTEFPKITVSNLSGEGKIGVRLENKSTHTIDGVANTGLFVANADGANEQGEKFFFADAPSTGKIVLMEDGLNVHGEGYRVACACGGRLEGSDYHSCSKVTWKPWKTANKLPTEGYYYLSTDISGAAEYSLGGVKADRELGIDLNGHTVTPTSGKRIFRLYDGNVTDNTYSFKLTITDNGDGTGKLVPNASLHDQGAAIWITEKTQTVNIFGGTVDGSGTTVTNKNPGGLISVNRGTLNIYDGTVLGCTYKNTDGNSLGAAIGISYNHNGGTLNLYGGSVVGGSADLGDAIYVDKSAAKFNAYGGTVTGSVYTLGNMTVGGTAQLEEVELADGVKLTVVDDLDSAKASIGIKMATPGVFAENVATDLSAAFTSVSTDYKVEYTTAQTLQLLKFHNHCWCVGADVLPDGHTCTDGQVWQAVNSSDANPFNLEDGGYYYLNWTNNVAKRIVVPSDSTAYLCLNGATIRASNTIDLGENSTIVICDCKGTGLITTTANSPLIADQNGTIRLMSGNVSGTYGTTASRVSVLVNSNGTFEMYGGSVTGGCAAVDQVTDSTKKEGTSRGGNITVHGTAKLMGGTISGGKYNSKDRDVTAYADGSVTVGGKVNIGVLFIPNNGVVNVVEKDLDATIGVAMQTPTAIITNVSTDVSSSFTSAQAGYDTVGWKDGALVLGVKADHQHCFCENAEALPAGHKCDTLIAWTAVEKASGTNFYMEDGGHYYLNWTGSSPQVINVPSNVEAYLCLNGATIYATQAIKLNSNSVLHICDCSAGKTGTITVSGATTTAPIYMDSGVRTVNLYSGRILGSANGNKRVSVIMSGGTPTFNMYGGTISGGYNTNHAGNISITGANAKFNMYGGTISGGEVASGKHGGNVYMSKGQFVMNGGTITGGKATGGKGGNVMLLPNGTTVTFTMNGGTIENGAAANGGNIAINSLGTAGIATFTMNGGTVKGGSATTAGENLFLYSGKDNVIVNAGSIIGGTIYNGGTGNFTVGAGATVDGLN